MSLGLRDERYHRYSIDAQNTPRCRAEINHPPMHERAAIVNADDRRLAIAMVDDRHLCPEWQRPMGGRHGTEIHLLPTGGVMAAIDGRNARPFEGRAVPTTSPTGWHQGSEKLITNVGLFVVISRHGRAGVLVGSRDPMVGVGEGRADTARSQ
jgi:hypothetical protein